MCKASLLSRSGLVLGRLAANALLNAPVEPNHLAAAVVNVKTDQRATEIAIVTRITLVPRATIHAIATQVAATMGHLVMESARAGQAPMVLPAAKYATATMVAATMGHLVMESARACQAPMVVHAVALVIATLREEFATMGHLVMEHAPVPLYIY